MKYRTYFLTYIAFAFNHGLRMCYSYNKIHIKQEFSISSLHLGILDAFIYISFGIGTFTRFQFCGGRNLTLLYLISSLIISCSYSVIPFISLFNEYFQHQSSIFQADIIIPIALILYGFSHLAVWQIILTLISTQWNSHQSGTAMGIWVSMPSAGNITGYLISNFMISTLKCKWQTTMLLFSIFNLLFALFIYFFLKNPQNIQSRQIFLEIKQDQNNFEVKQDKNWSQLKNNEFNVPLIEDQITTKQFFTFIKYKISSLIDFRIFFGSYIVLKVAIYSFLMWCPIYLYQEGFSKVSGYILTLFDVASILGAFINGRLSQYSKDLQPSNDTKSLIQMNGLQLSIRKIYPPPHHNPIKTICHQLIRLRHFNMVVLAIICFFLFLQLHGSLLLHCILIFFVGFSIGGLFHVYAVFNMMHYGDYQPRKVDMISNMLIGTANIIFGIFQIIIGFATNNKKNEKQSFNNFFYILLFLLLVAALLTFSFAVIYPPRYIQIKKIEQQLQEIQRQ